MKLFAFACAFTFQCKAWIAAWSLLLLLVSRATASNTAASTTEHPSASVSDLNDMNQDMEKLLNMHSASLEAWRSDYLHPLVKELHDQHLYLSELESDLALRTSSLQQNLHQISALQLQHLAKRLNETVHMELKTRQSVAQEETQQPEEPLPGITESAMKELIAGDAILDTAEASLKQWILTVVEKDVIRARVAAALQTMTRPDDTKSGKCLTPSDGAQLVQQSLLERVSPTTVSTSKTDDVNHLATAIVVHEWTSETYTAPPTDEDLLGHAKWRKHIPQDWETRWLPHGWQQWNMAMPDALVRSLVCVIHGVLFQCRRAVFVLATTECSSVSLSWSFSKPTQSFAVSLARARTHSLL
jgi:hypothetical protein